MINLIYRATVIVGLATVVSVTSVVQAQTNTTCSHNHHPQLMAKRR